MPSITVLIVDDQTLLRDSLERALSLEDDIEVVGSAADGQEAVQTALDLQPDVVLMDVKMPKLDGIEATRRIKESLPACRVLVLTMFGDEEYVHQAILAGADGYLLKDITQEQMVDGIRRAHRGECLIDPALMRTVLSQYARIAKSGSRRAPSADKLTAREVEVVHLVAQGLSNQEIADQLVVSVATVKTHLYNLYQKIGVRDRVQAALYVVLKEL